MIRVVYNVKDHHELLHHSPRLKNTCLRQAVLDKWSPLINTVKVAPRNTLTDRSMRMQKGRRESSTGRRRVGKVVAAAAVVVVVVVVVVVAAVYGSLRCC